MLIIMANVNNNNKSFCQCNVHSWPPDGARRSMFQLNTDVNHKSGHSEVFKNLYISDI